MFITQTLATVTKPGLDQLKDEMLIFIPEGLTSEHHFTGDQTFKT